MATRIIMVVHRNGRQAKAGGVWGRPNATLFEVAEGPYAGQRGPDTELFDLVGRIRWDRSEVSICETGERRPASG